MKSKDEKASLSEEEIRRLLIRPEFPLSAKYDSAWMLENQMGPNALWLSEWLCRELDLKPGMRVLDLGCGKAMTSIFLAREFGVSVTALDLWISPDNNWRRVVEAGLEGKICPIKGQAHSLPFAKGYFDAAVSIDAYHYFGTDEHYLDYLAGFVRPGGMIGVVVPGLCREFDGQVPEHLTSAQDNGAVFWENSCRSFKTGAFWKALWERTQVVSDVKVALQENGWKHWMDFENALDATGKTIFPSVAQTLEKDQGRFIGFLRLVAKRTQIDEINLYDADLGRKVGVDN
jgi:ubiquinone/menaquinone biosynthesis C-methylase UbiE